jgi:hypothetical protein
MISFEKPRRLVMNVKWLLAASAAVLVMQTPSSAQAFDCSKHFAAAQVAIDKVAADLKADTPWNRTEGKAFVQALLGDAELLLASAKHNHDKAQGAYDHARDVAKANAALGYANAADILHFELLTK